jgi:hypothetical protein
MTRYRFSESQLKKSTRELFLAYAPSGIVLSIMVFVPLMVMLFHNPISSWAIGIPIFLLVFGYMMVRIIHHQQALMKSYSLEVSDAGMNLHIKDNLYIDISPMEIKEITKIKNGDFLVTGPDGKQITIPHLLDNAGNLEQQLLAMSPINTHKKDPLNLRYRWTMLLLTAVFFLSIIVSDNKIVIVAASLLAIAQIGFVLYQIWKIKNLRYAPKRGLWFHVIVLSAALFTTFIKFVPDSAFTPVKSHRSANNPSSYPPPNPAG